MERRGEARKGIVMGFSGGKRRPRSGRVRDLAEEGGGVKMVEKKMSLSDELYRRDLERSSRDKKRDGAATSGEEEEEEYEQEGEEGDYDVSLRRPAYSQSYKIHPQKQRNCLSDKIAIQVPRKARTVSKKRMSNEWLESFHIKNSGRKKMKATNGTKQQKPATKISKQPSFIEDELEVAEFLFGLTRLNQENNAKNEPKSQENSNANSNPISLPNIAQKKKRAAILKSKEDNLPSVASTSKIERDEPDKKNSDPSSTKQYQSTAQIESHKEQPTDKKKEGGFTNASKQHFFPFSLNSDRSNTDQSTSKTDVQVERTREQKSIINLMGPPQGLEKKAQIETVAKSSSERRETERAIQPDLLCKERFLNLEFDNSEKSESNAAFGTRNGGAAQLEAQQQKGGSNSKSEIRQDKDKAGPPANLSMPMAMGAWPGNLPPIGFMGQVPLPLPPGLLPISTNPTSNNLQARTPRGPPLHRPKRCLTHCYLAKLIDYHQNILKMNPFSAGPPPAGAPRPPMFNLGLMPPNSDPSVLQMQANFNMHHSENNKPSVSNNNSNNNNSILENQRKQMAQSGPMPNMMHGPFMFPINQQQAAAAMAAAMAATANRPNTSVPPNTSSPPGRPMNHLTMPGLPTVDHQILTAFKNGTYPFPIPSPPGMAQQFRGGPQSMPWPFYPPQMPPHQQLRPNLGGLQQQQSNVQKTSSSFGPNQANQQDGDKNKGLSNGNSNNNVAQVPKNVYGQNYAMPFAFNAPRPAITRHSERTEEYKHKPSNSNATSAVGPLQQQTLMGLSELQKKNEKLLQSLHNNNNNNNTLEGKEGGEKNQNATSASSKLQTVQNNNSSNRPSNSNATSAVGMIQLQKKNEKLLQSLSASCNKNAPPGSERIWSKNSQSDFSQVVKTAFPHAVVKRMESHSPSTLKNNNNISNNNNHYANPQNRTGFPGTNASKTVQTGSKQHMGPTATSPSTSITKSSNNNNTGGSPHNNMSSKTGSLSKTPLTPPQQQHSIPKTNSPSVSTPRPPPVLKNPNTPIPYPNPSPNSLPKQNHNNQTNSPKDLPKQQVYPRPQFFYASPQQLQPYANGPQKRQNDNPGPVGMTVHRMAGPSQPVMGGAHARVPVSFAYLPVVAPVSNNKGVTDQKQGGGN